MAPLKLCFFCHCQSVFFPCPNCFGGGLCRGFGMGRGTWEGLPLMSWPGLLPVVAIAAAPLPPLRPLAPLLLVILLCSKL